MAKFTATVPLAMRLPGGFEIVGAAGATHRVPDELVEEFIRDQVPAIPGGVSWITQDEMTAFASVADLDGKYDKTGGTITGAVTATGAISGASLSATGSIVGATITTPALTATAAAFKGAPWYDVKAYGATGDGTTDDAAAITSTMAAAAGGIVHFPSGTYKANSPLVIPPLVSLNLEPGATIVAGAAMSALISTSTASVVMDQAIRGGVIDGGNLASATVFLRRFTHYTVEGVQIRNALVSGLKIGDSTMTNRAAEAVIHACHISSDTFASSSAGVLLENSGDHSINQVVINGYDIGIDLGTSGTNVLQDIHVWTDPTVGSPQKGFRDYGNNNVYVGCYADTPFLYGWHLGGFNAILVGCKVAMASNYGVDNIVIGVKYEQADPYGALLGCIFNGSSSHRLAADIESASYSTLTVLGSQTNSNLVATRSTTARASTLAVAGTISAATASVTTLNVGATDVRVNRGQAGLLNVDSNSTTNPTVLRITSTSGQRASLAIFVSGEAADRVRFWGDGTLTGIELGAGAGARDVNLYRSAANVLKTDDQLVAADGVTTKTVAGAVSDGSFTATPASGTFAVDTTNSKIYVRVGSTWKSVTVA